VELARRLEGSGVTLNALHAGFTATGFGKNNGKVMSALVGIVAPLVGRSPAKGAETSIYLRLVTAKNSSRLHVYRKGRRPTPPSIEACQRAMLGLFRNMFDRSYQIGPTKHG
jgi:hypothetical protein